MKNNFNLLLLALLACCLPVFGQNETNAPLMETNAVGYGNPAPGYPAPMPRMQQPPEGVRFDAVPESGARYGRPMPGIQAPDGPRRRPRPPVPAPGAIPPGEQFPGSVVPPPIHINIGSIPEAQPAANGSIPEAQPANVTPRFVRAQLLMTLEVCAPDGNLTNGCWEAGLFKARRLLYSQFSQEYQSGKHEGVLKIIFPATVTPADQKNFLYQTESSVIQRMQLKLQSADGKFLADNATDTLQTVRARRAARADLLAAVQVWLEKAQAEAGAGSNWTNDWPANTHTFGFHGPAYEQFKAISQAIRETY